VLLKNANGQLPLKASSIKSLVVIGEHAELGVLSGSGSDQVTPRKETPFLEIPMAGTLHRRSMSCALDCRTRK